MTANPVCSGSPFFEQVLVPHRSLALRNFHLLMGMLGLVSIAVGIGFVAIGAWPVIGFFGLDVELVYLGFRVRYRSVRKRETIRLAVDDIDLVCGDMQRNSHQ